MSERYVRVFALSEKLYTPGSPVIIEAGTLLKDNIDGKIVAQLKFLNLGSLPVKALTVRLYPQDIKGEPLGEAIEKQYLDLYAKQQDSFGQKVPVVIPDSNVRGYTAEVIEVVFSDNSRWEATAGAPWKPLPADRDLESILADLELIKQYRIKYGKDSVVEPQAHEDLWQCKCGTWNKDTNCYRCKAVKSEMLLLDMETLKQERDARVQKEEEEREAKAAAEQEKARKNRERAIKYGKIGGTALALLIAIILLYTKVIAPNSAYGKAKALMDAGNYEEAAAAFQALEGKKDSAELAIECSYLRAKELMDSGKYEEAIEAFDHLKGEKDSSEQMRKCMYELAKELKAGGKYDKAVDYLIQLGDYEDAKELLLIDTNTAVAFLSRGGHGEWNSEDGNRYFKMTSSGNCRYNIPSPDGGEYFLIEDGIYKTYDNINKKTNGIRITVQDENTITMYSFKDYETYVLIRN